MVFFIIIILITIIIFSKIRIEIENIFFSTKNKERFNKNYKIKIKFKILNKFTIAKTTITSKKLEKMQIKEKIKEIDINSIQKTNKMYKKTIEAIKNIEIQFEKINLYAQISTENAFLTSMIIPVITTIIEIILSKNISNYKNKEVIINPIYNNQNMINISFSGIFEFKMIHIINMIYILNKKGRVNINERTSNRRSYDYSYE